MFALIVRLFAALGCTLILFGCCIPSIHFIAAGVLLGLPAFIVAYVAANYTIRKATP